jgi:hypothetical protein
VLTNVFSPFLLRLFRKTFISRPTHLALVIVPFTFLAYGSTGASATSTISAKVSSSLLSAGGTGSGTLTLSAPAGQGGVSVAVANSNPTLISVSSAIILVAAGQTSASFTCQGVAPGSSNLTFSAPTYNSASLTVTTASAAKLMFGSQPAITAAGAVIASGLSVLVIDSTNHEVFTGSYPITLSIGVNPNNGALQGNPTVTGTGNVFFPNVALDTAGAGYTLIASSPGLASATSVPFNVSGAALNVYVSKLISVASKLTGTITLGTPAGSNGLNIAVTNSGPQFVGVPATTISIAAGKTSGTFAYTGVAPGTSTVSFSAPSYVGASVAITTASPAKLIFGSQPSNALAGAAINPGFSVLVIDATGHEELSGSYQVNIALAANPGNGSLGGTESVTGSGNSFFSNLSVSTPGVGYTLVATSAGLPSVTSAPFNITGPPMGVSLDSYSIPVGSTMSGSAKLAFPAPAGGATIAISSSAPQFVSITPATVSLSAGQTTVDFSYTGVSAGAATFSFATSNYLNSTVSVKAVAAANGSGVPDSFFGLSVLNFTKDITTLPFYTTRTWDAYPLDWADLNPSSGTYNFSSLDTFIQLNQSRGSDIIYTLGRTPQWASSKPNQASMYYPGQCAPPASLNDWDDFLQAIATHAAGRIKYWELWNEPDDTLFYCGDVPTMVLMAQHAENIIKGIDPSAVILGPGVTSRTWLTSFLADGGGASVDVIAFHGYASGNAEDIVPLIASYRAVMSAGKVSTKPLWDTEGSWGAGFVGPVMAHQVGFVAKYYLLQWSLGVDRFVWYAYDGTQVWGGLSISNSPTAAATAYRQTYSWLVGASMTQPCVQSTSLVWTCGLTRPGGYAAEAVWIPNSTATFKVPAQFVQYLDLAGVVHPITSSTLSIGDQPILLETGSLPE